MDEKRLWEQFALTPEDARAIHAFQEGKCAICKKDIAPDSPATCGDHNHKDGTFRGWLCFLCNRALGLFGDDIGRLKSAVCYLEGISPAVAAVGPRYGTVGRKAKKLPRNRRPNFYKHGAGIGGVLYRCGCRDTGLRPKKCCPVHGQPIGGQ
jgi:hypothetical protein